MNKFWNVQRLFGVIVSCLREVNRRDNVLAMFWKKGVEIDVLSLSSNHIDILIAIENEDEKWRWYMIITNWNIKFVFRLYLPKGFEAWIRVT